MSLLAAPLLANAESADVVRAQLVPNPQEDDAGQAEPPPPERADAVPADEPEEVTAARLAALPVAGKARLLLVREGVRLRQAEGARGVYVGSIHDEIELGLAYYTDRVIDEAAAANAVLLVWEIETPGGRVDAAIMMRDLMLDSPVPSIAYVNRRAWSAGALISLGNDLIVVADGASIGAATPVMAGGPGGGMQPVEEKVVSALRGEFRAAAEANGRSAAVAESMVDADLAVGGIIESGRLLTLTGSEALAAGIAEDHAATRQDLLASLGLLGEEVIIVSESWAESLVRLLTSSAVAGLLMLLGMLGIFFELTTPGFGWAGAMGIGALMLFFAGHLLVNLAGSEEILLFLLGIILLGVELFVLPGFGVAGVLGVLAVGASLTLALINLDIDISLSATSLTEALLRVALSLVGTVVMAALLLKLMPHTTVGRRLVLSQVVPGGTSIPDDPGASVAEGDDGLAVTDLRPYGKARIGGRRVEVVAEGSYITKGQTLRVVRVAGYRIEVRATGNGE